MKDIVTAVVMTSPVISNPSTEILDKTLDSIRHWFPDIAIALMYDGVRPEQEHMRKAYREFYYKMVLEARANVRHYPFIMHKHQIGMMREFLKVCDTPYLLFLEHDTPLVTDEEFQWEEIFWGLDSGFFDFIRFLPEPQIHPEHEHLMCGQISFKGPGYAAPVRVTKTRQFSARPHLATKVFYERVVSMFSPEANCFIEDKMHGICQDETLTWEDWRMVIYTPDGNQKRSLHLDGRAGASKFDETQVF